MSNENTFNQWSETAKYWTRHRDTICTMFAPLTRALVEQAGIGRGQSVLDVAGGAGEPSLTIAETVGPEGSVMCTDPIAEMLAAAETDARERGLTNVQFRQCAAGALPFGDDGFDVVVCRLGVMFFPDPLAGLKEMLRVTKPAGRVALVVWHKSEVNPFCHLITDVVSRHVAPAPPAEPDAPNAFRFAEEGKLARLLENAGATNLVEHVVKFDLAAPISEEEFWTMRSETSDTLRTKLRSFSSEQRRQIGDEVKEAARQFFPAGHMNFPTQMIIVTGTKGPN